MKTMRTAILVTALLAPSMALAPTSWAQETKTQETAAPVTTAETAQPSLQEQMQMGTPEERAACRSDVRKHCTKIDISKGDTHLGCLKSNRDKISKPCQDVLTKYGQ